MGNPYEITVQEAEGKSHLGALDIDGRMYLG
jgi:hypothetical protein